jgi:hypothetical protein
MMSKKIDLHKLLTKGSAKQRVALLVYHYTILKAIDVGMEKKLKPILTEAEAQALLNSFKDPKDIKTYNNYRLLNEEICKAASLLCYVVVEFERDYYKYLYEREIFTKAKDKRKKNGANLLGEDSLLTTYCLFFNYYNALKIYAKEKGYTNKYILDKIDSYFKEIRELYKHYPIDIGGGVVLSQRFEETEPNYEEIKHILLKDFNYQYEPEEE